MIITSKKELDRINLQHKNIMILGKPSSGKTTLANKLIEGLNKHKLFHTDNYTNGGFLDLTREIKESKKNVLIEGSLAYDLLANDYKPDVIIKIEISDKQLEKNYWAMCKPKKIAIVKDYAKLDEMKFMQYILNRNNKTMLIQIGDIKLFWKSM